MLAKHVDGVICIARWKQNAPPAVAQALRILELLNANVIGVALTRVDMAAQSASGYGEAEYFYRYYKDYYAA